MGPTIPEPACAFPWLQTGKVGVRGQGFGWRKVTDTQAAQGWEETTWAPPNHPVSPWLWVLPLPIRLTQQSQSFMPLAAWEQRVTDVRGHPFRWQNLSLFCLHRRRLNVTPVPDFLHQKCTASPVPLQLLCVFGLVAGNEISPFAIICCVSIERDLWWLKRHGMGVLAYWWEKVLSE